MTSEIRMFSGSEVPHKMWHTYGVLRRARTMYSGMYMACTWACTRVCAPLYITIARLCRNRNKYFPQRNLRPKTQDLSVRGAGLRNPARTLNPALTRRRNMLRYKELWRRAGLPG